MVYLGQEDDSRGSERIPCQEVYLQAKDTTFIHRIWRSRDICIPPKCILRLLLRLSHMTRIHRSVNCIFVIGDNMH